MSHPPAPNDGGDRSPLADRRHLVRTHVPGPLRFRRIVGGASGRGEMQTLSGDGLSFITGTALRVGEDLDVEIVGAKPLSPTLSGRLRVLRSEAVGGGAYRVAGAFLGRSS